METLADWDAGPVYQQQARYGYDVHGRVVEAYDALGRLAGVPGRDKATETPSIEYGYMIRASGPNAVTTRRSNPAGQYVTSSQIFDGLLRARQAQAQFGVPTAGRTVIDCTYTRGGWCGAREPAFNTDPVDTTVLVVADGQMPARTRYVHDGAARVTDAVFYRSTPSRCMTCSHCPSVGRVGRRAS